VRIEPVADADAQPRRSAHEIWRGIIGAAQIEYACWRSSIEAVMQRDGYRVSR
jgi:hypothetical protein